MSNQSIPLINHFSAIVTLESLNKDFEVVKSAGEYIVKNLNLTIVQTLEHSFTPQGTTLIHLLSESHLALHTWPEYKTVHINLLCGAELNPSEVKNVFKSSFDNLKISKFDFVEHKI